MAERCPWQRGAYGRAVPLAERGLWPSGSHRRTARMAEWPMWPGGAHARVAYVAERLAWPIGFTNLTSGAHKLAEVTHFQALSKFVRSTRQVCARCCLGWGCDTSRLAAGGVSQAAHNRQRARYRLGFPRHRHQPALHRQCERLWGCVQNDRVYEPSEIPPSQPQRGSAMTPYTDAHSSNGASTRRPSVQCRTRLSPR